MPLFFRSINLRFLLLSFRLLTIGIFQCIVFLYCVCSPNNNVTICQMNMQIKWSYIFGKNKASWQQIALTAVFFLSITSLIFSLVCRWCISILVSQVLYVCLLFVLVRCMLDVLSLVAFPLLTDQGSTSTYKMPLRRPGAFLPQWRKCPARGRDSGWTTPTSREEGPRNANNGQGCSMFVQVVYVYDCHYLYLLYTINSENFIQK